MPLYRIEYILKISTERFKNQKTESEKELIPSSSLNEGITLSFDDKNKQLVNQLIYKSIALFTTGRGHKDSKITEDITDELLAEHRRRRLYGTPSEDSRRR
jgi:hypothetical protein